MSNPSPDEGVNVAELLQVLAAWDNEIRIAVAYLPPASRARLNRIAAEHTRAILGGIGHAVTATPPRDEDTEELLSATVARSEHPGVPVTAPRTSVRPAAAEPAANVLPSEAGDDGPEGSADLSQPMSTDESARTAATGSTSTGDAALDAQLAALSGGATNLPDFGGKIDLPDFGGSAGLVDFGTPDLPDLGALSGEKTSARAPEPEKAKEPPTEPPPSKPGKSLKPAPTLAPEAPASDLDEEPDDPTPVPVESTRRPSLVDDEMPLLSNADEEGTEVRPTHDVKAAVESARAKAPIKRSGSRGEAMQDTFDIAPDAHEPKAASGDVDDEDVEMFEEDEGVDDGPTPSNRDVVVKPGKGDFDSEELTNPSAALSPAAKAAALGAKLAAAQHAKSTGIGGPKTTPPPSIGAPKAATGATIGGAKPAPAPTLGGPKPAAAPAIGPKAGAAAAIGGAKAPSIGKGAAAVAAVGGKGAAAAAVAGGRRPIGGGGGPLPTIRDANDPKPKSAAIQLGATPGAQSKVLGFEEEEEPLEMGEAEGDIPEGDGFSLQVEEYEEEEYEEEEEESEEQEKEEETKPLPPPPEPTKPTAQQLHALMNKGAEAKEANDMEGAIAAYSDLLDVEPDHMQAHLQRGLIYLAQADYARAMSDFTVAEDLEPNNPDPQVAIGELFYNRKDYRKAIDYFNAAIELDPNHGNAHCQRGIAHYHKKEYEDAIKDLTKAQKLSPDNPHISTFLTMAKKKAAPAKK